MISTRIATEWKYGAAALLIAGLSAAALNAARQQPSAAGPAQTLTQLRWMTGTWRAIDGDETTDETWLPPHANSMVGVCRIATPDNVVVYELMLIEQAADGSVTLSMRHYRWNMVDRDKEPIRWKLAQADGRVALFEDPGSERFVKLSYERVNDNKLRVTLTPKSDPKVKMRQVVFELNRVDHTKGG